MFRSAFHRRAARAALAVLWLLAGCGGYDRFDAAPVEEPARTDALAPYEAAQWPDHLHRLDLPRTRDYVILSFLPTNHPFDLSTPTRARWSLIEAMSSPGQDTRIGHAIVAWQCGPNRGMTSMTGASGPESGQLVRDGWGFVAALSTYSDGRLYPEGEHRLANLRGIEQGRAIVTAVEVDRAECEAMRDELTRFVTHPNRPATRYGLMLAPERYEGAGCISFGFYLANAAGAMEGLTPAIRREVTLYAPVLGRAGDELPGVAHYRPPAGCCETPVPPARLLASRWDQGPPVDRVHVEDGELVVAALVAAREDVAPDDDWRFARMLPEARDPYVARAAEAGRAFAADYPVRRIADAGGVAALVLERE